MVKMEWVVAVSAAPIYTVGLMMTMMGVFLYILTVLLLFKMFYFLLCFLCSYNLCLKRVVG